MSICIIILHNCERYGLNLQVESKFTRQSLEIDGLRAICALVVVFGHSGMSFISAQTGVTFFRNQWLCNNINLIKRVYFHFDFFNQEVHAEAFLQIVSAVNGNRNFTIIFVLQ